MKVMKRNGTEVIFDITKIIAAITKANIVKLADGNFLKAVHHIGETEYPDIEVQELSEDEPLPLCGGDSGPGGVPDHGSRGL